MLIQLTPANSKHYVGYNVVFTTRNQKITKKIIGVSESGKTIYIDHPDLNNSLQLVTRKVFVQEEEIRKQEELLKILESLEVRYNILFDQEFQTSLMDMSYKDAIQSIITSIATKTNYTTL